MNIFILIFMLLISVYYDLRFRKIPNKITVPSLLLGFSYWILSDKFDGLMFSLFGVIVGFIVFIIPYFAGGMGAGDVKLMMAVGALLGWELTMISALYTAISGGIIALGYIIFSKSGKDSWIRLYELIVVPILKIFYRLTGFSNFLSWQTRYDKGKNKHTKNYIPYAIPIAIGTLLAVSGLFQGIINF